MQSVDSRSCTKCGRSKPLVEFSKAPRGRCGVKANCKSCDAARHLANPPPSRAMPAEDVAQRLAERRGETKECTKCGQVKSRSEFSKNREGKHGPVLRPHCKACSSAQAYRWFLDNRERAARNRRRWNWSKFYGLSEAQYWDLLQLQAGVCAVCRQDEPTVHGRTGGKFALSVDHCHQTGIVRGLLCQKCNRAIGLFGDDPELIQRAAEYLLLPRGEAGNQGGQ